MCGVSILVLMDGVLRGLHDVRSAFPSNCFNPCSNGWCTSSPQEGLHCCPCDRVSILVLMDGVLRGEKNLFFTIFPKSFNPCSNGWCTSSLDRGIADADSEMFQSLF